MRVSAALDSGTETPPGTDGGGARRIGGVDVLTAAGLAVAALAHPLLDVLVAHPTVFAAHKADGLALAMFAAAATAMAAATGAIPTIAFRALGARLGRPLATGAVAVLAALLFYRVGRQLPELRDSVIVAVSIAAGALAAVAHLRSSLVRFVVSTVGCSCLIVVPGYFLARALPAVIAVGESSQPVEGAIEIDRPTPIVFVVFDALRLVELLDDDAAIDEEAFPNFARLSREATWYRNTTTVDGFTADAVPALLTGRYPTLWRNVGRKKSTPTLAGHPVNLFTLLAGSYEMFSEEPITDMCPADACNTPSDRRRIVCNLLADGIALLPYVFGTRTYVSSLPPIDAKWKDFGASDSSARVEGPRQLEIVERWLDDLDVTSTARLHFLHTLAPHKPFRYTADGLRYREPEIRLRGTTPSNGFKWSADVETVAFEHARYRMQVQAVDRALGRIVQRLKKLGVYDETILVVTSDHGVTFRPGGSHRHYDEDLHAELFFVPLFIKAAGQTQGTPDDRPAQTIDVLPTLLEMIGVGGVDLDGRSLIGASASGAQRFFIKGGEDGRVEIGDGGPLTFPPRALREAAELGAKRAAARTEWSPGAVGPTDDDRMPRASAVLLPPSVPGGADDDPDMQTHAYFVHGMVLPDRPIDGWPAVELSLDGEAALLGTTVLSREIGRVVFEGIVESHVDAAHVHEMMDVGLRWRAADGRDAGGATRIERSTESAESYRTTENAFWYAYWQGHSLSVSCSEEYRRAFLGAWRRGAESVKGVMPLAQVVRSASAACAENASAESCSCSALDSLLVADTSASRQAVAAIAAVAGDQTVWDDHWRGIAFERECPDRVKERFVGHYQPSTPATWVRPPFVVLRAAIEDCRNQRADVDRSESRECDCFSFAWADAFDAEWSRRWRYTDPVKGPAFAVGSAILDASDIVGTQPRNPASR